MIKKNDEFDVEITGYTSKGYGVGKYGEMPIFIENTAVGDTVGCHIIKVGKAYCVGKLTEVKIPSPDRIPPKCAVFNKCGGCAYCHLTYEAQLKLKEERVKDCFKRIGHLDALVMPIMPSPKSERYRNKAQYPVRRTGDKLEIGFFARKSHRVIDDSDCFLQPVEFNDIKEIIRVWIKKYAVSIYSEAKGTGLLRHIFVRKAESTGEISVCLVINGKKIPEPKALVNELLKIEGFKTLTLNINREDTNVILGKETLPVYGDGFIEDVICGVRVRISPQSFYQVNKDCAELLYKKVAAYADLNGEQTVLDLYCGTGTIGLTLADKAKSLIGAELVPEAVEDARKNAQLNNITNAEFICGDAAAVADELKKRGTAPDVVIIDPPRKGCSEELLKTIADMSPEKTVYVSCDPATLARDCAVLSTLGYEVTEATPVDMFPGTTHVETVCLLSRTKQYRRGKQ